MLRRPPGSPPLTCAWGPRPSGGGRGDSTPPISALTTPRGPQPSRTPSGWSQRWDSNPHVLGSQRRGVQSGLSRPRKPVPPRWEWSARGDSNPDLHGLNVPRLPIAPRADDGGDHGWSLWVDSNHHFTG